MNVDTHFHIFDKSLLDDTQARYSVQYDASLNDWSKVANHQNITRGVIIQPSFLGFDNTLLLQILEKHPHSFKGVASVHPSTNSNELIELRKQGIRGIRLNLYGNSDPIATLKTNKDLINQLPETGLHLQIHHDDGLLNQLLLTIPKGVTIVVDHFGRPISNDDFIKNAEGTNKHVGNLWVKLSAQYRTPKIDHHSIFQYWRSKIGDDRLVWGSDWPHTQFEGAQTYDLQMKKLNELTSDPVLTKRILFTNPQTLYWD